MSTQHAPNTTLNEEVKTTATAHNTDSDGTSRGTCTGALSDVVPSYAVVGDTTWVTRNNAKAVTFTRTKH